MTMDTPEKNVPEDQGGGSSESSHDDLPAEPSRRAFFQRVAIGGGAALLASGAAYGATRVALQGHRDDKPFKTEESFKSMDQRDVILCYARSKALNEKYPERNEQYARLQSDKTNIDAKDFHAYNYSNTFEHRVPWDNNKPGYTQLDKALHHAAWHPLDSSESHGMAFCQPNTRMLSWDQSDVEKEQYQFKSKKEAAGRRTFPSSPRR
jgi:hypothetical protein